MRMRPWLRHRRAMRGRAIVEAAITLPVYLFLALGLVEGALMVYSLGVLGHAVGEGARLAALPSTGGVSAVQAAVANAAASFNLSVSSSGVTIDVNGGL